jgi:aminoglycoside phosphotransferase (APT) family kinase protein
MTDTHGIINDIMVPSAGELLDAAEEHLLKNCNPTGFHGDFILDNILVCDNSFTLLDWRQDFGGELESGDMYYDIAKLNHNLVVNHDIINADLFTIDTTTTNVKCDIMRNHRLVECQDALYEIAKIKGLDINKIQILTAIIWINMAPLHENKLSKFLFYFGRYSLHNALRKI